ncbi:tRNA (adenosine(37)-N6)-dimethylallyltransferase MiaA [Candidatus Wolfebacteria bacterium]|nr:tRNA (adenosine(37)-N6)-dimethylallyltransferase MiaA [Candidatus Wolfebacteria bacterium]
MSTPSLKEKIIVILGPTASGKSDLAVKLAKKFNGEIISADSRQVYKGLNLGSGKITKKEMRGIPHHLLDVVSPKKTFTVAQYQKLGQKAIKKILKKNKIPIICGGTGLYIDALIYGWQFPEVPPQPKLRKKLEKFTNEKLFEKLKKIDPRRAKNIDKHNRRRLIRALEIIIATGKPVPHSHGRVCTAPDIAFGEVKGGRVAEATSEGAPFVCLKIGIKKSGIELKKSIKKRLIKRLKMGMVKEVKNLHKQWLGWKRLDNLGLEYRFISRYLRGIITKKEMENSIIKESVKYAKRQMTWFKRDPQIHWIKNQKETLGFIKKFLIPSH